MKKDIFLFHYNQHDPLTFFKIRNADLRNPNLIIDYRGYISVPAWRTFVESFIAGNSRWIFENNIIMDYDFEGFILMYYDTILEKKIIITDPTEIVTAISE